MRPARQMRLSAAQIEALRGDGFGLERDPCPGCGEAGNERYGNERVCWDCFRILYPERDDPVAAAADAVEPSLREIPAYPVEALPEAAQALVRSGERQGLPVALLAGAALAAMAAAMGSAVEVEVTPSWHERPILWVPLLAPRGAGKSPSLGMAFDLLRQHDENLVDEDGADDDAAILLGDQTLEALARSLDAMGGAAALDVDELAVLLRGLGEYKRGNSGDRGRFLGLWTGAPWRFARVGRGGKRNDVSLRISRPTVVICGGLQSALHDLLGGEEDGLRPRWLPHLAAMPSPEAQRAPHGVEDLAAATSWRTLIERLIDDRERPAVRELSTSALAVFERERGSWKQQAADRSETSSTTAALVKADVHLARIALVLYEADPNRPQHIEANHVERAAQIVHFVMGCWRALPEPDTLALSHRDGLIDRAIVRLIGWLEEHGGQATRRELLRAHVAGVRTADDLGELLARYEAIYPATLRPETPTGGGKQAIVVSLPKRGGG